MSFRGPRDSTWSVRGGMNLQPVPEFCGGFYATSFSVCWAAFNVAYARPDQAERFESMPSVSDFFTPEQWAEAVTRYNALPPVGWPGGFDFGNDSAAGMRMGVVSVMTQLMLMQRVWSRGSCSFWDTRGGATRLLFKWAQAVLQGGISAPRSLTDVHYIDRPSLYDKAQIGGTVHVTQDQSVRAYPTRYITGMFLRNPNSGSNVAQSTFYVTGAPRRGAAEPPAVKLSRAVPSREMLLDFLGPQRKGTFGNVPDRFHPM
jgi:hypothetical protein